MEQLAREAVSDLAERLDGTPQRRRTQLLVRLHGNKGMKPKTISVPRGPQGRHAKAPSPRQIRRIAFDHDLLAKAGKLSARFR
jgi:hypothetical protein